MSHTRMTTLTESVVELLPPIVIKCCKGKGYLHAVL